MAGNTTIIVGTILIVISLLIMIIFQVNGGGSFPIIPSSDETKVVCDVQVNEGFLGLYYYIASYTCYAQGTCGWFSGVSTAPLSIFGAQGNIQVVMGGEVIASKRWETKLFTGFDEVTLTGCTTANTGTLRLLDDENNLIDSKTFTII